jgi:hypothetical protein
VVVGNLSCLEVAQVLNLCVFPVRIVLRHAGPWQAAVLAAWMAKKRLRALAGRRGMG